MKTKEEILKSLARDESYNDWPELMYDTHPEWQLKYTKLAMKRYADQFKQKWINIADKLPKHGVIIICQNGQIYTIFYDGVTNPVFDYWMLLPELPS